MGARNIVHGGQNRPYGGISRFSGTSSHGDMASASLAVDHPAVLEDRTLFPSSVVTAEESPKLLISGHNSAKIGDRIAKGPWRGLEVFTFSLEERATCPPSCGLLRSCYGNAMPFARRHTPSAGLENALRREIAALLKQHRQGIAIRLHVLGDFFSEGYARFWVEMVRTTPRLHVWGYTAHPANSRLGRILAAANDEIWDRWAFRFSVASDAARENMQSSVAWDGEKPSGLVCPAQTGRTAACSTCALCWSPVMLEERIVFIGHGMSKRGKGRAA